MAGRLTRKEPQPIRRPCWTKQEDALLGTMSDERLARKLHRSPKAVRARRHLKRIAIRPNWRPEEEKILGTRSDIEVAKQLGRTCVSVTGRRRKLGIPSFNNQILERKLAALTDEQIARLLRKSHRLRKGAVWKGKGGAPKWSPSEDGLLGKWPDERLARFLGRTKMAVQSRRLTLGILYSKAGRRWTPEEVRQLDPALVQGRAKEWTQELASKLGRSFVSAKEKRRLAFGASMDHRPWTKKELRMLGTRPDAEVAAAIGRRCGTVQCRRCALGIPSFRARSKVRWTPAMDRQLGTRSDGELARHLGIAQWAVQARRQQLGISSTAYRNWTREEERLIGTMPDKEAARRIGRTAKAVWHRRLALKARQAPPIPTATAPFQPQINGSSGSKQACF